MPFLLVKLDSVYAKIVAVNVIGESLMSEEGNGASVVFTPDAPYSLSRNDATTIAGTIGLTWVQGLSNGGSPVLDYSIIFDQAKGVYISLATGVTLTSFVKTGLTVGQTYKFRVQSRNDVGFSDYSAEIAVIASTYPKAPVGLLVDHVATTAN